MATMKTPIKPLGSMEHVPEFISNQPDPATGVPAQDSDRDIHDTIYTPTDRHVGVAEHSGDMGRLSKL